MAGPDRIEVTCSDPIEHLRRVGPGETDIAGRELPTWPEPRLIVDTASPATIVEV